MTGKIKYKGYVIEISPDEDAQNPYKDWDQLSDTNFWLRNYNLDSTGKGQMGFDGPQEVVEAFQRGEIVFYAPIYAYIHGGITVSMGERGYPFNCPWDSGLAGMVYVTKEKAKENWPFYGGRTLWLACGRVAKVEIETLDQYLTGDVWAYNITKKGWDPWDGESCCGFYGYDYCLSEAKGVVDQLIEAQERLENDLREDWAMYSCPA